MSHSLLKCACSERSQVILTKCHLGHNCDFDRILVQFDSPIAISIITEEISAESPTIKGNRGMIKMSSSKQPHVPS
ncbi:hypothetical protein [Argonema galeatum]|uniref:hypothetical protein n=1 Tax=Argonema galeatum TaxID=2942762 RepID=UPI002010D2C9|nr:hypothetical protein [Argonema galeatum]MCL1467595.1 hypothetical protein [Argonema galeatum A003/A1]